MTEQPAKSATPAKTTKAAKMAKPDTAAPRGIGREVQRYLEDHLLHWHGVTKRKIFGHDGYHIDGRLFAFVGDEGVVLKPPVAERDVLRALPGASGWSPDPGADRSRAQWIEVPCATPDAIDDLLPYLSHAMAFIQTAPQTGWRAERKRREKTDKPVV